MAIRTHYYPVGDVEALAALKRLAIEDDQNSHLFVPVQESKKEQSDDDLTPLS